MVGKTGNRHADLIEDDVILPKHITDEFYAFLMNCYNELFYVSLATNNRKKSISYVNTKNGSNHVKEGRFNDPVVSVPCEYISPTIYLPHNISPTITESNKLPRNFPCSSFNNDIIDDPITDENVLKNQTNEIRLRSKSNCLKKNEKSSMGKIISSLSFRKKLYVPKSEEISEFSVHSTSF